MEIKDNNVLSLNDWVEKYKNITFRMLEYKKVWTPYEMNSKFVDESEFKDTHYAFVRVCEAVTLPSGDVLLKLADWEDISKADNDRIYYWRNMKDIQLDEFDCDKLEE